MVNKALSVLAILALSQIVSSNNGLPQLVGRWVEDEALRTGLNDFLWARGVNWFKRQYATSLTTWQYEQTIMYSQRTGGYEVSGIKGPLREVFRYTLTPDNKTVEMINLGAIGGERATTAFIDGNSLVSHCKDLASGVVDMIATRTILPENRDIMYFKTTDVPYGYEMVATMRRKR